MILLSGSSGFVGQNIANKFPNTRSAGRGQADYSWTSIKDADLHGMDVFIHTSGKAHDLKGSALDEEYFDVNVGLTKTFFEAFLRSDAKVFIHFSSVKAVADYVDNVLTEDGPATSIENAYGRSKREAEDYLLNTDLPEGKKLYILRPCMIHGPGNKGNLNLLYNFVSKGIPYPLGDFHNERSFLAIDNLLFIIEQLMLKMPASGVYNVSDDGFLSTSKLIELIAEEQGRPVKIWSIPKGIISGLASIGDVVRLPLNSTRLMKMTEDYRVSNAKIKEALGVNVLPVSVEEGIRRTIRSFGLS